MSVNKAAIHSAFGFISNSSKDKNIELDKINDIYSATVKDENRKSYNSSYSDEKIHFESSEKKFEEQYDNMSNEEKFGSALASKKSDLMQKLNITNEEEYDSLSCVALALASQETGFGHEDGYDAENTGIIGVIRDIAKGFDVTSASSGLTQIKINDFIESRPQYKELLESYGLVLEGKNGNNLYENPDLSAIATMVVLSDIYKGSTDIDGNNIGYNGYNDLMDSTRQEIEDRLILQGQTPQQIKTQSNEIINELMRVYNNASTNKEKEEIASVLNNVMMSVNGSKVGDKTDKGYNEEENINKLNELLKEQNSSLTFDATSLDYVRYALTDENRRLSASEYCATVWNSGARCGTKPDKLFSVKLSSMMYSEDNMKSNQYASNVAYLADLYYQQAIDSNS